MYHGIQPIAEGGIIHVNLVFERDQMTLTIPTRQDPLGQPPQPPGTTPQAAV